MKVLAALLLLLASPAPASAPPTLTMQQIYDSTVILYVMEGAKIRRSCTASLFQKDAEGYLGVTAAHCLVTQGKKRGPVKTPIFASLGRPKPNDWLIDAKPVVIGRPERGYDIAVVRFPTKRTDLATVPLGKGDGLWIGQDLGNVSAPLALGKFFFHGPVASLLIEKPLIDRKKDINWIGSFAVDMPVMPGCSGSAVISADQAAIVGVVVGSIGSGPNAIGIVIPLARLQDRTPGNWWLMPSGGLPPA